MRPEPPVVQQLMELVASIEFRTCKHVDYEKFLPKGKTKFTSREVCNAIGEALTEQGIPNNLKR